MRRNGARKGPRTINLLQLQRTKALRSQLYQPDKTPRYYAHNCTNPTRLSYSYYSQFDHEAVDCPTLISKMREKGVLQPTLMQNIQMMRSEPREEDPNVNMVLKSGATIGEATQGRYMGSQGSYKGT